MPRLATPVDVPALSALHIRSFVEGWDGASLAALLDSPGTFAVLAQDQTVDGFILVRVAADEAEILTLAVEAQHRRHGLGSSLLEQASQEAERRGARRIFLEVASSNMAAANLYEKYGFSRIGLRKAYYADGGDAQVLSARLPLRMGNSGKTL